MSVLIRFCLIESFNFKVEKGNVLMCNLKDLVGTEDFLNRLELTFHQFLHLINFASFFVDMLLTIPCLRYTYLSSNFVRSLSSF